MRISGQLPDEPNCRSENESTEFPVKDNDWHFWDNSDCGLLWEVELDYGEQGETVRAKSVRIRSVEDAYKDVESPVQNEQAESVPEVAGNNESRLQRLEELMLQVLARLDEVQSKPEREVKVELKFNAEALAEALGAELDKALRNMQYRDSRRRSGLF